VTADTRDALGNGRAGWRGGRELKDTLPAAIVLTPAEKLKGGSGKDPHKSLPRTPDERLQEAAGLARALGLNIAVQAVIPLSQLKPATLFGSGKVEELGAQIEAAGAGLAIVDHALSPVQQRNLEQAWKIKVIDRTGLILEIFAQRARTKEGRLQVELAHLNYQKSRLVRSWTHLDRQRGGFGFLGGPGETQIEADRRLIGERITAIRADLETVRRTRGLHREGRRRVPYPAVAIAGYTNAGKSTLFNRLTGASVTAENQLFATLDPTMREVKLPGGGDAILSDTVGFISDLPAQLIAAFRATLEDVVEADIILHVRDMASPGTDAERDDVYNILRSLGISRDNVHKPIIEVWNKCDLLDSEGYRRLHNLAGHSAHTPVLVSAAAGQGLDTLLARVADCVRRDYIERRVTVSPCDGSLLHWLHESTLVLERQDAPDGTLHLTVRLTAADAGRLDMILARKN
jgi:GTP-binding protein HflX